jgi:lipopolysaccharide export system protein LptC
MSASDIASAAKPPDARPSRPRPPLIAALRVALPAFAIGLTLLVVGWTAFTAIHGPKREGAAPPQAVYSPHLTGQDDKQRPFVITAATAVREAVQDQRIDLDHPVLTRSPSTPDWLHVTAIRGVYDDDAGRLYLSGDVHVSEARGTFVTPSTVYDTRTGSLMGAGGVQGAGDIGDLTAGDVSSTRDDGSVVYSGGVHTHLIPK